ncbi:hypothetical protein C8F01DRAFT_390642 [Mycena amicta]|nr:hypothetical protein C8F01DRAFT_390642 [Mycena amicta]
MAADKSFAPCSPTSPSTLGLHLNLFSILVLTTLPLRGPQPKLYSSCIYNATKRRSSTRFPPPHCPISRLLPQQARQSHLPPPLAPRRLALSVFQAPPPSPRQQSSSCSRFSSSRSGPSPSSYSRRLCARTCSRISPGNDSKSRRSSNRRDLALATMVCRRASSTNSCGERRSKERGLLCDYRLCPRRCKSSTRSRLSASTEPT